jgi:hypothetical protein
VSLFDLLVLNSRLFSRVRPGEQQVDEALSGRLRLVVGQARPLVGLDEDIGAFDVWHEQVEPDDGDVEHLARPAAGIRHVGMEAVGDVMNRPASVEVRVRRTRRTTPSCRTSSSP